MTIRLLFTDESLQAWIGFFTRSWASHVDAFMPNGHLLGARPVGGVAIRGPHYHNFTKLLQVDLPCDSATAERFYGFLEAQVCKPYDWRGILSFWFRRDWQEDDSWTCAELITAALIDSGYFSHRLYVTNSKISPADLLMLLSTRVNIGG